MFPPMWPPTLQPLFVLAVSGIATCTVALFLIAGFALSAFDDIGRNIQFVHSQLTIGSTAARNTIEDVRSGVVKLLGSARNSVVWSQTSKPQTPSSSAASSRRASHDEPRSFQPRHSQRPSQADARERMPTPPPSRGRSSNRSSFDAGAKTDAWESDDDFDVPDVPHSTPFASRPPSPTRTGGRSRRPSTRNPPPPDFPPRPRLSILIPSIMFALLFTAFKLLKHFWFNRGEKLRPN